MVSSNHQKLLDWLQRFPKVDGIYRISTDRRFQHEESNYDAQYQAIELDTTRADFIADKLSPNLIKYPPCNILEIACGPGTLTLGLSSRFPHAHIVATDASSTFLHIMDDKVKRLGAGSKAKLTMIQLADTEFGLLPNVFDLICIRSGLHHFLDWPKVLATLAKCLNSNGVICMLEPKAEFFILSSILLQLMLERGREMPVTQATEAAKHIKLFQETAKFYICNEYSKESAEDKYAFFVEDLQSEAAKSHLHMVTLGAEFACGFKKEFLNYLQYCMSFPPSLVSNISSELGKELSFLESCYESRLTDYGAAEWYAMSRLPIQVSS